MPYPTKRDHANAARDAKFDRLMSAYDAVRRLRHDELIVLGRALKRGPAEITKAADREYRRAMKAEIIK